MSAVASSTATGTFETWIRRDVQEGMSTGESGQVACQFSLSFEKVAIGSFELTLVIAGTVVTDELETGRECINQLRVE